jgi:N-acyl homoserine lactone hydrolase
MGITVRAMTLAEYDIPYASFVSPVPNGAIARGRSAKLYRCPSIAYVIEHPDGRVLWETSVATTIFRDWPQEVQDIVDLSDVDTADLLEARLRAMGLGPEDFDYVVMGHLHCDHAGGLRLFESTDAEIVVHERELSHVLSLDEDRDFYLRVDWGFLADRAVTTVSDGDEILRDVWVHHLPGHTPGLMGVSLRLDHTGWTILASDAIYTVDSYGPPAVGSAMVWDAEEWRRSVEKLRRIAHESDALLIPGHDEIGIQHDAHRDPELREIGRFPGCIYE